MPPDDFAVNPYVGPRTFTEEEGSLFFGREREANDLLSLVVSERLVLFYAQSGAGKSSLINARLLPKLTEEEGFVALPVGRVSGDIPPDVEAVANIFTFNLATKLDMGSGDLNRFAQLSLVDFLANLSTTDGKRYVYEKPSDQETASGSSDEYEEPPHVLVIDQFEEFLSTHLDRWQERQPFLQQLTQAMEDDPLLWVVLTMREDYVAALKPFEYLLPGGLRARYYMQRLGAAAALEAIEGPARLAGRPFAENVAQTLVKNLSQIRTPGEEQTRAGQFVEPVELQVVCYRLWQNLADRASAQITYEDLQALGDVDEALSQFYETSLSDTVKKTGVSELRLRSWFDKELITEANTRGSVFEGATSTSGMDNEIVHLLAAHFLLRAEERAGGRWYELIHDRLVLPIIQANQRWYLRQGPLIQAAQAWEYAGRSRNFLYEGSPLQEALSRAESLAGDPLVSEFLSASREEQRKKDRIRQRERRLLVMMSIAFLVAAAAAVAAFFAQQNALRNAELAQIHGEEAIKNAALAATRGYDAQKNLELAVTREAEAQMNAGLAATRAIEAEEARTTAVASEGIAEAGRATAVAGEEIAEAGQATAVAAQIIVEEQLHAVQTAEAEREAAQYLADAQNLAAAAEDAVRDANIVDAYRLAVSAYRMSASLETERALFLVTAIPLPERMFRSSSILYSAHYSPDGQRLVLGQLNGQAVIWNLTSGEPESALSLGGLVGTVEYSRDGSMIVAAQDDQAVVFDAATGERITTYTAHSGDVERASFSPDGTLVVSSSGDWLCDADCDYTARIWNARTGEEILILHGHTDNVYSAEFSPDGTRIVTASQDGTSRIWDAQSGAELVRFEGHINSRVNWASFSPDGRRVVTAPGGTNCSFDCDFTPRIYDARTGNELATLTGHRNAVRMARFSPDGKRIVTASNDWTVSVWDSATGVHLAVFQGFKDGVRSASYSPDGQHIVTASESDVWIWDANSESGVTTFSGHTAPLQSADFSPEGGQVLTAGGEFFCDAVCDNTARIWDVASGEELIRFGDHTGVIYDATFSPDGQLVATGSADGSLRLWDVATGRQVSRIEDRFIASFDDLAFSPDGNEIAANAGARLIVWNVSNGEMLLELKADSSTLLSSIAVSADGTRLAATADFGDQALIWDARTGQQLMSIETGLAGLEAVDLSPDGRRIAVAGNEGGARIFDAQTGTMLAELVGHTRSVTTIAFSPDGSLVATGSEDTSARLWDAQTGQQIAILYGVPNVITEVAFSPDGSYVVAASLDKTARIWIARADLLLALAEARLELLGIEVTP